MIVLHLDFLHVDPGVMFSTKNQGPCTFLCRVCWLRNLSYFEKRTVCVCDVAFLQLPVLLLFYSHVKFYLEKKHYALWSLLWPREMLTWGLIITELKWVQLNMPKRPMRIPCVVANPTKSLCAVVYVQKTNT